MAELKPGAWMMKGTVLIACNCDYGCPCNVNARPTHGDCEGGWIWQIEQGAYGGVNLDGLHLALLCDWPKAIHEGDGVAVAFIDERADAAQRAALRALVEGAAGGPWGIFRKTFRELHGPRFVRFESDTATQTPRARAGDAVVVEMEHIRNPLTQETIHPRIVLPEGLVVKEAALVGTKRFVVSEESVRYDHSGHYGAYGFFQYYGS